jgi:hypothetical protein
MWSRVPQVPPALPYGDDLLTGRSRYANGVVCGSEGRGRRTVLDRSRYILEVEDTFDAARLDDRLWLPRYLPHWTTGERAAARYVVGGGRLVLRIDEDQPAWSPHYTGGLRVSGVQTGLFAGPVGSRVGQHRFRDDLVVREGPSAKALYTPQYGLFEIRARFLDDPAAMAAFWLIGYEDAPERSAEICVAEIFGRDVGPERAGIGMGIHPFHDPALRDDFSVESVRVDVREPHWYTLEWTPERVSFHVDDHRIRVIDESPAYPMQVMLDIFESRDPEAERLRADGYPKRFVVEAFRTGRLTAG